MPIIFFNKKKRDSNVSKCFRRHIKNLQLFLVLELVFITIGQINVFLSL